MTSPGGGNPPSGESTENTPIRKPFVTDQTSALHHRLKFYRTLQVNSDFSFTIPTDVVPPELFVHPIFSASDTEGGKQSSITTIFSIWNTMIGSSLLALPWGFTESGFAVGLACIFLIGSIALYSAILIIKASDGEETDDFGRICLTYLGKPGQIISWGTSLLVLLGACMAYDILMSNSLFKLVQGIIEFAGGPEKTVYWTPHIAPIAIWLIVYPLANLKELSILLKINSLGIFFIIYIIAFIVIESFRQSGGHFDIDTTPEFQGDFYYLAGMLLLSFFIHNFILPILSNQKNPEHNVRDVSIGFTCVAISLAIVAGISYICFGKVGIDGKQDFFQIFHTKNIYALTARLALILQLSTVMPVILYVIRIQFFGYLMDTSYPGPLKVALLNFVLTLTTTLLAVFEVGVGTVLRFTGSAAGLIYVFLLPILVYGQKQRSRGELKVSFVLFNSLLLLIGTAIFVTQFFPAKL